MIDLQNSDAWLIEAEARFYNLEITAEQVRAQHRAIDGERADIGMRLSDEQKELARYKQTARILSTQTFAGIQDAISRNDQSIVNTEARIKALQQRMDMANARQQKLADENKPLIRLMEGCRKAMTACKPVHI